MVVIAATLFVLTLPMAIRFYQAQISGDAAQTLLEALRRARTNAAAARNDSPHGLRVTSSSFVVFQGPSYASRTAAEDEILDYADTLAVSGTRLEFVFSKLYATTTAGTVQLAGPAGAPVSITVASSGVVDIR